MKASQTSSKDNGKVLPPKPDQSQSKKNVSDSTSTSTRPFSGKRPVSANAAKLQEKKEQLTKIQIEKLSRRVKELEQKLASTVVPEPKPDQKITKEFTKRQATIRREIESWTKQKSKHELDIRGLETGVTDIIQEVLLERFKFVKTLPAELRDFWLSFRRKVHAIEEGDDLHDNTENKEPQEQNLLFIPPTSFSGTRASQPTFQITHAAALTHDIQILRRFIVDTLCEQTHSANDHTKWYDPEPGQLNTPLHLATMYCYSECTGSKQYRETAKFLIDAMPYEAICKQNSQGDSAILYAAAGGALDVVKALVHRKVDVEPNVVLAAIENGRLDVAEFLFNKLMSPPTRQKPEQLQEQEHSTLQRVCQVAIHVLVQSASRNEIGFDTFTDLMDFLQHHVGLDVNAVHTCTGETPLHIAVKEQNIHPVAIELIRRGADPAAFDYSSMCPSQYIQGHSSLDEMYSFFAGYPGLSDNPLFSFAQ